MKRYFYSIENDNVIPIETVNKFYHENLENGSIPGNETFDYFLQSCMYWNNGDLMPIIDKLSELHKRLKTVLHLAEMSAPFDKSGLFRVGICHDYDDEVDTLQAQIKELEKYW